MESRGGWPRRRTLSARGRQLVRVAGGLAFAVLAAEACASSAPVSSPGTARPSPTVITADEIARANAMNAYEVVQKLRPAMLRPTQFVSVNAQASGDVLVYLDNTKLGGVEQLRQITPESIAMMRYYSPSAAQIRWGSGHPGGAIEVTTKR